MTYLQYDRNGIKIQHRVTEDILKGTLSIFEESGKCRVYQMFSKTVVFTGHPEEAVTQNVIRDNGYGFYSVEIKDMTCTITLYQARFLHDSTGR